MMAVCTRGQTVGISVLPEMIPQVGIVSKSEPFFHSRKVNAVTGNPPRNRQEH
jgi:hypothetical protein